MEVEIFSEVKKIAVEKWREYKEAAKKSDNPVYKDLQKVYNQIKGGKKIIDISKVIKKGGVHENFHPKLAIAKASSKMVRCRYFKNGNVHYLNKLDWRNNVYASDISLPGCLPELPNHIAENGWWNLTLEAPVPIIPAKLLPEKISEDMYILWEVDEWKKVPPTDPYLLKRIAKNFFVVLACWDLTPLEKAAMSGRMY